MAILSAENFTPFLATFTVSLIICLAISKWLRERNYPPGPIGLPFVGYGPFLGKKGHEKLTKFAKQYGDVYSMYLGPKLYIIINDFKLAKEILTHPLALARPDHFFEFMLGRGGMISMNGEGWQEQRRFAFYTMRNLGLGKGLWETMIQESVADFIEEIKSWKGKPFNMEGALTFSQASNGISLLIGRHLDKEKDAANVEIIRKCTREFMKYFTAVSATMSFPALSKVLQFFRLGGYNQFYALVDKFQTIFSKEVEERMKNPESLAKEDFIGCFFREMEKKENEGKKHTFTIENLIGNLIMLFIAGNDSTMASVSWSLLLMASRQDVQKKVHDEIDDVIGRDGIISFDDRHKFPYIMATILEMNRWVAIAPIFPPRCLVDDYPVNGYILPKGANIICNGWGIMRDPRYYDNPDEFKPERFLSEDGNKVVKSDGYLAFSLGKRNCPGEGVAIMTLFLYFVSIMQKFHIKAPPGKQLDLEPIFGGALLTKPQDLCFIER